MTPPTLGAIETMALHKKEAPGLMIRTPAPLDGRILRLSVTNTGANEAQRLMAIWSELAHHLVGKRAALALVSELFNSASLEKYHFCVLNPLSSLQKNETFGKALRRMYMNVCIFCALLLRQSVLNASSLPGLARKHRLS
jgi:DNA-binding MarR family transcriptional regulator